MYSIYMQISRIYHRACYWPLTNNSNIKRAQVRCLYKNTECEEVDPSSSAGEIDDTEQEEFQPVKKMLRIICKREKSYFTESVSLF